MSTTGEITQNPPCDTSNEYLGDPVLPEFADDPSYVESIVDELAASAEIPTSVVDKLAALHKNTTVLTARVNREPTDAEEKQAQLGAVKQLANEAEDGMISNEVMLQLACQDCILFGNCAINGLLVQRQEKGQEAKAGLDRLRETGDLAFLQTEVQEQAAAEHLNQVVRKDRTGLLGGLTDKLQAVGNRRPIVGTIDKNSPRLSGLVSAIEELTVQDFVVDSPALRIAFDDGALPDRLASVTVNGNEYVIVNLLSMGGNNRHPQSRVDNGLKNFGEKLATCMEPIDAAVRGGITTPETVADYGNKSIQTNDGKTCSVRVLKLKSQGYVRTVVYAVRSMDQPEAPRYLVIATRGNSTQQDHDAIHDSLK